MPNSEALLPEYDLEMANARKVLERVPEDKFGWKPHEKSGTMVWLAGHIANIPGWPKYVMESGSLDVNGPMERPSEPKSRKELLDLFDRNAASGRAALAGASDEQMMQMWTLRAGEKTIFTLPRAAVVRSMVMNHLIHHRGQLTIYLRLAGVPLPALYGPSADEQ